MIKLWTWLVGKVGKVFAALIAAVSLISLIFLPFYLSWKAGWNARDAQVTAAEQKQQIDGLKELATFTDRMQGAIGDYVLRRGQDRIVFQTITQEIPHVVTVYKTSPDVAPKPLPQCVFTTGFVRLWNLSLPDSAAPTGSDGTPAGIETTDADLYDSGVTEQQVLDNHVNNSAVERELRRLLLLAQAYIRNLQHLDTKQ